MSFDDVYFGPVASSCVADGQTLCIDDATSGHRFQIVARYGAGGSAIADGDAAAISLAPLGVNQGGLFWFFAPDNPELLIKVLHGCPLGNRFWIFAAAGTNVATEVFVTDVDNGKLSYLHNPANRAFPTVQDTGALPCP